MRRNAAVGAAVLAALGGEWVGHSLVALRTGGVPGLVAGLTGGVHSYMIPVGLVLLLAGLLGATAWVRLWLALGRRMDRSAALLRSLWRTGRAAPAERAGPGAPSGRARYLALALPLALVQCVVYLIQENIEAIAGGGSPSVAPLFNGFAAGAFIQASVALVAAAILVVGMRLLDRRTTLLTRMERLAAALRRRSTRPASSPAPPTPFVAPIQALLRWTLRNRPPPPLLAP